MIPEIESIEVLKEKITREPAALFYFSHDECNVCKILKPKVFELLKNTFPEIKMYYINTLRSPELAGQQSIFAVPTLLVYFDKREFIRKSRNIGINELHEMITKPYNLMFN